MQTYIYIYIYVYIRNLTLQFTLFTTEHLINTFTLQYDHAHLLLMQIIPSYLFQKITSHAHALGFRTLNDKHFYLVNNWHSVLVFFDQFTFPSIQ